MDVSLLGIFTIIRLHRTDSDNFRNFHRYGTSQEFQGGWCLPCILFLTESEKSILGVFVCSPFTNYNKSIKLLEKHSKKDIFTYVQLIAHMNLRRHG